MDLALLQAEEAFARGDWPVAAILVKDDVILSSGQNRQFSRCDRTWHAETEAIREAFARTGCADLAGSALYSTMECCPMCAWAAKLARVSVVVLGARHAEVGRKDLGSYSMESFVEYAACDLKLITGVRHEACLSLRRRWGGDAVRKIID